MLIVVKICRLLAMLTYMLFVRLRTAFVLYLGPGMGQTDGHTDQRSSKNNIF